jgi:hypothetical protein
MCSIYNVRGRKIYQQEIQAIAGENEFTLNISTTLSSGLYFIRMSDNTVSATEKIIIVR